MKTCLMAAGMPGRRHATRYAVKAGRLGPANYSSIELQAPKKARNREFADAANC